jgi:hypothetical protein
MIVLNYLLGTNVEVFYLSIYSKFAVKDENEMFLHVCALLKKLSRRQETA